MFLFAPLHCLLAVLLSQIIVSKAFTVLSTISLTGCSGPLFTTSISGNLYVSCYNANSVGKYTGGVGSISFPFTGACAGPQGLVAVQNTIYAACGVSNYVMAFNLGTNVGVALIGSCPSANTVDVSSNGDLAAACYTGAVLFWAAPVTPSSTPTVLSVSSPWGVSFNPTTNDLFVALYSSNVIKWTSGSISGSGISLPGTSSCANFNEVTVTPGGVILGTCASGNTLYVWPDASSAPTILTPSGCNLLGGVAVDSNGYVYASCYNSGSVIGWDSYSSTASQVVVASAGCPLAKAVSVTQFGIAVTCNSGNKVLVLTVSPRAISSSSATSFSSSVMPSSSATPFSSSAISSSSATSFSSSVMPSSSATPFSSSAPPPLTFVCVPSFDAASFNLSSSSSVPREGCSSLCRLTLSCVGFVYDNTLSNCYLKSKIVLVQNEMKNVFVCVNDVPVYSTTSGIEQSVGGFVALPFNLTA